MRWRTSLAMLWAAGLASAQEPATQRFGREQGLPHDQVRCLHQDGRGYLWIGTAGRVCRHDGTALREWPASEGVPERVDRIASAGDGRLFLGSGGPSLWVYDPRATPCFQPLQVRGANLGRNVAALAVDARQRLFVATETGLFVASIIGRTCELQPVQRDARGSWYAALLADERGRVLFANSDVALRIDGDERVEVALPHTDGNVWGIVAAGEDRWCVLGDWRRLEVDFAVRSCKKLPRAPSRDRSTAVCTDRRGRQYVGTVDGLWRLGDGEPERLLAGSWIQSLCTDRAGDVWVGTQQHGLVRLSARPFAQLRGTGGNGAVRPVRLLRAGNTMLVATASDGLWSAGERALAPTRFAAVPELRCGSAVEGDGNGNLWFATEQGLLQVPPGATEDASTWRRWPLQAQRLRTDVRGRVMCNTPGGLVTMVDDGRGAINERLLALPQALVDGFALSGDGDGLVYCCTSGLELWRVHDDAAERCTADGAPFCAWAADLDLAGRLWIVPTNLRGFAVVDPRGGVAWTPRWIRSTDGLPGENVMALAVDGGGGAWLALAPALAHFDATTGRIRSWPWPADVGLAGVNGMEVAPDGRVLVATDDRVIAFDPKAQLASPPAPVLVTALLVDGRPMPLPDGGTSAPETVTTPAGRGNVSVTWCAPGAAGAGPMQHRLLPSSPEFGAPERASALQLASLAWGDYRLELRSAAIDGMPPGPVTTIAIRVPPPLWWRPEFLGGIAFTIVLGALLLHRARTRRLLAMEAVRRQIALDLHDDLGSGLAQVAVLSEVVKRDATRASTMLDEIGGLARGMRESMSDIVWAVDPRQDTLGALVQRLRQVACNLFGDATVVRWHVPDENALAAAALAPDRRRHLFLFAKEALTNVARHADSTHVNVDVVRSGGGLRFCVSDDGRGFDLATATAGSGLRSLQVRANALGGALTVRSQRGSGTTIELSLPAK